MARQSHLSGLVFFAPKFWARGGGPRNAVLGSVNVDGVVILLAGGRDTSTLHDVMEVVSTYCDLAWSAHKNLVYTALTPLAPALTPLHLPCHPLHLKGYKGCEGARAQGVRGHKECEGCEPPGETFGT